MEHEAITLKGNGDGVIIRIARTDDFKAVTDAIAEKIRSNRRFFSGNCNVYIESVEALSKSDIIRLKSMIDTFLPDCDVTYREPGRIDKYNNSKKEEKTLISKKKPVETATVYEGNVKENEHLRVVGNAVVIGNVEKNALVTAGGNIIVLGNIYGCVRAGYPYKKEAYIVFKEIEDGEISIGDIAYNDSTYKLKNTDNFADFPLKKAHLINNSIFIAKFL